MKLYWRKKTMVDGNSNSQEEMETEMVNDKLIFKKKL